MLEPVNILADEFQSNCKSTKDDDSLTLSPKQQTNKQTKSPKTASGKSSRANVRASCRDDFHLCVVPVEIFNTMHSGGKAKWDRPPLTAAETPKSTQSAESQLNPKKHNNLFQTRPQQHQIMSLKNWRRKGEPHSLHCSLLQWNYSVKNIVMSYLERQQTGTYV